MLKITDEEIRKVTEEIFGKDDYSGLVAGLCFGVGFITIGIFSMFL